MPSLSMSTPERPGLVRFLPTPPRSTGDWLELLLRLGVGGAFVWAGLLKLMEPNAFARIIGDFGLVPKPLWLPLAWLLPVLEIVGGVGVWRGRGWGLGLVTALDLLFMGVLVYGLRLGLDIDCGCFGPDEPEPRYHGTMRQALWRDAAFLAAILFLYLRRRPGTERPPCPLNP